MTKSDEMNDPRSCLAKADPDEICFVLLARDPASPIAIRSWIAERIRSGKNTAGDDKVLDAERCARAMEAQRHEREFMAGWVDAL